MSTSIAINQSMFATTTHFIFEQVIDIEFQADMRVISIALRFECKLSYGKASRYPLARFAASTHRRMPNNLCRRRDDVGWSLLRRHVSFVDCTNLGRLRWSNNSPFASNKRKRNRSVSEKRARTRWWHRLQSYTSESNWRRPHSCRGNPVQQAYFESFLTGMSWAMGWPSLWRCSSRCLRKENAFRA